MRVIILRRSYALLLIGIINNAFFLPLVLEPLKGRSNEFKCFISEIFGVISIDIIIEHISRQGIGVIQERKLLFTLDFSESLVREVLLPHYKELEIGLEKHQPVALWVRVTVILDDPV
jgi:hypothetical protein